MGGRRRRTGTPPPPPVRRRRRLFAAGAPYADRDALADRLLFVDLADFGPLWTVDRFGPVDTADSTPLDALERLAANVGARLLVIDPLYAAFGGSEVDRAHAGAFLTRLRRMAADLSAAVLVVAHPPKGAAGADRAAVSADPSGVSTWRDGVRAVWRMAAVTLDATTGRPADADARRKRPDDCRTVDTLTLDKANYGRIPDEPLYVRCDWRRGWQWLAYDAPAEVQLGAPDKRGRYRLPRRAEAMRRRLRGETVATIAEALDVSPRTIKRYLRAELDQVAASNSDRRDLIAAQADQLLAVWLPRARHKGRFVPT